MGSENLEKIINSVYQGVAAFYKGGYELPSLLANAKDYSSLLEAVCLNSRKSLDLYIAPQTVVSEADTASVLAFTAYKKAEVLSSCNTVYGLGVTFDHRVNSLSIAIQTGEFSSLEVLEIAKEDYQLTIVKAIVRSIENFCRTSKVNLEKIKNYDVSVTTGLGKKVISLLNGHIKKFEPFKQGKIQVLYSIKSEITEYNHLLSEVASGWFGLPVFYEMSIKDFPNTNPLAIEKIIKKLSGEGFIVVTNTSNYLQKAELFPGSYFVIDFDGWNRLINLPLREKFIEEMKSYKIKFLVFGKEQEGSFINITEGYGIATAVPQFLTARKTIEEKYLVGIKDVNQK